MKNTLLGLQLIEVLQLKIKPNGRVDTRWGDKTPLGLALTVRRLIEETDHTVKKANRSRHDP